MAETRPHIASPNRYTWRGARIIANGLSALTLLAGCDVGAIQPHRPVHLKPCYDTASTVTGTANTASKERPLLITQGADGKTVGDPGMPTPDHLAKLAGAAVRVNNSSGVIVRTPGGKKAVLSAAHVVRTPELPIDEQDVTQTRIEDQSGRFATIIGACVTYETAGKKDDLNHESLTATPTIDLAVLFIDQDEPFGSYALPVAPDVPKLNTWQTFYNFQNWRSFGSPANFNGLVIMGGADAPQYVVLTGIQPERRCRSSDTYRSPCAAERGASGGAVVSFVPEGPQLTGISVATSAEPLAVSNLKNMNVVAPPNADFVGGWWFVLAGVVSPPAINEALRSPVYQQQ